MKVLITGCLLFLLGQLQAQMNTIELVNPSFEDLTAGDTILPTGWINTGVKGETPPDVQPSFYEVYLKPSHGDTYLGMVVRKNNTWESVAQDLNGWMHQDSSYSFSLDLANSDVYKAFSRKYGDLYYTRPTILRIWGVNTLQNTRELLAESVTINHHKWKRYSFILHPNQGSYNRLELSAYYAPGKEKMNGNLLMDNCSDLKILK
ncbi:MAG: hypothetical protein JNM22_12385 [Saprospiraceae bacterium]|nr:hypothetical protein [Saprospiraceae bacterium]